MIERRNEHTEDPNNHISLNPDEDFNQTSSPMLKLPALSKASLLNSGMKDELAGHGASSNATLKVNK